MAEIKQWVKLWSKALLDPELDSLDIADFGRWVKLILYVREHGKEGTLEVKPPARSLVSLFQCDNFECVIDVIRKFPNCNIVIGVTCNVSFRNWFKYQVDSSTARVRKYRANVTPKRRGEEKRREKKRKDLNTSSAAPEKTSGAAAKEWDENDAWMKAFLETQSLVNLPPAHQQALLNPDFWERTSEACGGVDLALLQVEFAKMGNWLTDHPSRFPTAKGIRRFVSGWLERSYEKERRYGSQAARR